MFLPIVIFLLLNNVYAKYYKLESNISEQIYIEEFDSQNYSLSLSENNNIEFTSIIYFLNICGYNKHIDINEFSNFWYSTSNSFKELITKCSYDQFIFNDSNNLIVNLDIPCAQNINNFGDNTFSLFIFKWFDDALSEVSKKLQINILNYRYHIMNLPEELSSKIKWGGIATVGCGIHCPSWYNGIILKNFKKSELASLYLHEIGHNLKLEHSNSLEREYGDDTCTMGNSYTYQCFNAPNSYKLNWNNPKYIIEYGKNKILEIESRSNLRNNFILIKNYNKDYYIDYRTTNLIDNIENSINVYTLLDEEAYILNRIFEKDKTIFIDDIIITTLNYTSKSVYISICYENSFLNDTCKYSISSSSSFILPYKELIYGLIGACLLLSVII